MSDKTLDTFRQEDFEQMERLQNALVDATLPFRDNTDPLLFVLALARCLRTFLDMAEPKARKQLLPLVVAFLRGEKRMPTDSKIWMPREGPH